MFFTAAKYRLQQVMSSSNDGDGDKSSLQVQAKDGLDAAQRKLDKVHSEKADSSRFYHNFDSTQLRVDRNQRWFAETTVKIQEHDAFAAWLQAEYGQVEGGWQDEDELDWIIVFGVNGDMEVKMSEVRSIIRS